MEKYGLTEKETELLKSTFEKFPEVETVFIYGSRAKNTFKKTSDIDLAVRFKNADNAGITQLKSELDDLPIIYEIDLTDESQIESGDFKNDYDRTKQIFYIKDWKTMKLGAVKKKIGSGATPRGGADTYKNKGIALIRSQNVHDFKFEYSGLAFIDEKQADELANVEVETGDILLNITGDSVARVCAAPEEVMPARVNQHVCIIRTNDEILNRKYVYYFLLNPVFKNHLLSMAGTGATRNALTKGMIENLEIFAPIDVVEQRAIAAVLSSLDSKIELLREQNKTLEATAQAIFKEWFVNFNFPNAEGNPYKSAGGKMIDSEFGKIPEGWRVGTVIDLIKRETISYRCDQDDLSAKGRTPVIDQGTNGLYGYTERDPDFEASKENPVILFTNHTCNMWFVDYPFCAIQNVIPFRGNAEYSTFFVFYMTLGKVKFVEYKGHWPDFEQKKYIIPKSKTANQFAEIAKPIQYKIWNNNSQIQTLSTLRDALLPCLMSGKIRLANK